MLSYRNYKPTMDERQREINEGMRQQDVLVDQFERMYEYATPHKEDENAGTDNNA